MANSEKESATTPARITVHPDSSLEDASSTGASTSIYTEPADYGAAAWMFLVGAFLVELMSCGFQLSFGVFEDYFTSSTSFDRGLIPYVGTLAGGINYLACPIVTPLSTYKPSLRKPFMYCGLALCIIGSVGSSFATEALHLVLGQGLLYGIGVCLLYLPTIGMMFEWFDERRGLAAGIMFAGGGMSGVTFPFAFEWVLSKYGNVIALRAWAVFMAVTLLPIIFFTRSRRRATAVISTTSLVSQSDITSNAIDDDQAMKPRQLWQFLRSGKFWFFSFATLFQGLGFYLPTIWIPTYATHIGFSIHQSTALQTLLNVACVIGQVIAGHLSDRIDICYMLGVWQLGTAATVYFVWGFSQSFAGLAVFTILYGLFAGGFSSLWPRLARTIPCCGTHDDLQISLAFGCISAWRGVGYLASGPLSNVLLAQKAAIGYALEPYGPLILFTGTTFVVAAGGALGKISKT